MGKRAKKLKVWFTSHIPVPLLLIGGIVIALLLLNDDVSISRNYSYMQEITGLRHEIQVNRDSAAYYRAKRRLRLVKENTEYEEDLYDEAV